MVVWGEGGLPWEDLGLGGFALGGFWLGRFCRGDFGWGGFALGGFWFGRFCLGRILVWEVLPGGFCSRNALVTNNSEANLLKLYFLTGHNACLANQTLFDKFNSLFGCLHPRKGKTNDSFYARGAHISIELADQFTPVYMDRQNILFISFSH